MNFKVATAEDIDVWRFAISFYVVLLFSDLGKQEDSSCATTCGANEVLGIEKVKDAAA